ncbi:MAG: glutamate--cysteine ligase [Gammaproteobacteria bacterium]|nr:glutamate--cysteine ligase [Gammaproteobacteria bacterium]
MRTVLERRLDALNMHGGGKLLAGGERGIEKESLRITPEGLIAQTQHPVKLGSALTNKYVTTDYSEALLEFVTPPESSAWAAMQFLCDLHQFTYDAIDDELLWPLSMPCKLRSQDDIPLADYGRSNIGQMKTIYRNGLGHRYGRVMQVISGIHFNYSLPEQFWPAWAEIEQSTLEPGALKSENYMGLVRNVRRLDWLLLYLFGASPAVCPSFLQGAETNLEVMDNGTRYGKWATSLRMSDLGYQNSNQAALQVSANSLDEYVRDLSAAMATPNDEYVRLGVKKNGEYLQLNANHLQIENEFYSTIRPKRVARSGERPTTALSRGGIEYIELRALDVSPFDPVGISQPQQKFLEAFLIYCLLLDSPPVLEREQEGIKHNHRLIAQRGREPELELLQNGEPVSMKQWATTICQQMRPICVLLDESAPGTYIEALDMQIAAINESGLTPSARVLTHLADSGQSFADYGLSLATDYRDYFSGLAPEFNTHQQQFAAESVNSLARQTQIEGADKLSLDEYLADYYA